MDIHEIADLRRRIDRIEAALIRADLLEEPKQAAPAVLPTVAALNPDFWDEPNTGHVHIRYEIECLCGLTHDALTVRVPSSTPNPFRHTYVCDKAGPVSVFFNRKKESIR